MRAARRPAKVNQTLIWCTFPKKLSSELSRDAKAGVAAGSSLGKGNGISASRTYRGERLAQSIEDVIGVDDVAQKVALKIGT